MLTIFDGVFDEVETYSLRQLSKVRLKDLLDSNDFIALTVLKNSLNVGGGITYEN